MFCVNIVTLPNVMSTCLQTNSIWSTMAASSVVVQEDWDAGQVTLVCRTSDPCSYRQLTSLSAVTNHHLCAHQDTVYSMGKCHLMNNNMKLTLEKQCVTVPKMLNDTDTDKIDNNSILQT